MRNPLRVRFIRDVALLGGTQVGKAFGAMVGGILVARALGPSAKGVLSVLVALGSLAVLLASLGVHQSGIYFLGRFKSEREAVISNTLLFGIVGGILTGGLLFCVAVAFQAHLLRDVSLGIFALFVVSVPFSYFNSFGQRIALGLGRIPGYNVPDVMEGSLLLLGTAAALVIFGHHLAPLVALRVIIQAGITLFLLVYIRRATRFRFRPSRSVMRRQMSYGMRNYVGSLLWLFLLQSDLVLCNTFLGSGPTGIYSVAVSLGMLVTVLAGVVGTLIFQRVSSDESRVNRIAKTNRTLRVLVPLLLFSAIILGVTAKWVVVLLYGTQFSSAAPALVLLLPGLVALSVETVIMSFLAGEGSPRVIYWGPFVGLVANLGGNLFVIPRWGIDGAATTSTIGYGLVFALVLGYYLRWTGSSIGHVFLLRRGDLAPLWQRNRPSVGERNTNRQTSKV